MERFDKKTMNVYSKEYDMLLEKEINCWSKYASGDNHVSSFEDVKKTCPYLTYRKGTVEMELGYIKKLGNNISILELGSADGWLTNEILKLENVKDITSIDIALVSNKEKYNDRALTIQGDLNKIDKIDFNQKYDCIITHGTLHHLVDPKKTLEYCIDNLLNPNGIIIINDSWILNATQLKLDAFFYALFNKTLKLVFTHPRHAIVNFFSIPKIIMSKEYAAKIIHNHDISPFESISSADDYKDIYSRNDVEVLLFKNLAALGGLQNSWGKSPAIIKNVLQTFDNFLIKKKILTGDIHICIIRKKIVEHSKR